MKQSEINTQITNKIRVFLTARSLEAIYAKREMDASATAEWSIVLQELRDTPGMQELSPFANNAIRLLIHKELREHLENGTMPDPEIAKHQRKLMKEKHKETGHKSYEALQDLGKALQALSKLQRARACLHVWELASGNMTAKRLLQSALKSSLLKKGAGDPVTLTVKPGFLVLSGRVNGPWSDLTFRDADSLDQAFTNDDAGTHCIGSSCDRNGKSHAWSAPIEQKNRRRNHAWTGSPVKLKQAIRVDVRKS